MGDRARHSRLDFLCFFKFGGANNNKREGSLGPSTKLLFKSVHTLPLS